MQKTISIEGMMCPHCAGAVEKALSNIAGVDKVTVNLEAKNATVVCADTVADAALQEAVQKAGYTVLGVK